MPDDLRLKQPSWRVSLRQSRHVVGLLGMDVQWKYHHLSGCLNMYTAATSARLTPPHTERESTTTLSVVGSNGLIAPRMTPPPILPKRFPSERSRSRSYLQPLLRYQPKLRFRTAKVMIGPSPPQILPLAKSLSLIGVEMLPKLFFWNKSTCLTKYSLNRA